MPNKSNDYLRLDVNSGTNVKQIFVRQNDTVARTICCSIVNNGKVVTLAETLMVTIRITRPDGTFAYNGCVTDGNEIQYTLRTTDISVIGEHIAQFEITYKNGENFLSPTFKIQVYKKNLDDKTIKSVNEYTALAQQIVVANNAAEKAEEAIAVTENARDEAKTAAEAAFDSERNAKISAINAATSSENASLSSTLAENSSNSAASSAKNALISENNAGVYSNRVETKATEIIESTNRAEEFAQEASASAEASLSSSNQSSASAEYSRGFSTDASESATEAMAARDSAEDFYQKTKALYDSIGTSVQMKGTKRFEELDLATTERGWMYNISEDFITTDDFEEGAGVAIARGTNIYKTDKGTWDCMAATAKIVVDSILDEESENPVMNATLTKEIKKKTRTVHLNTFDEWEALTDAEKDDPNTDYIIDEELEDELDAEEIKFVSKSGLTSDNLAGAIDEINEKCATPDDVKTSQNPTTDAFDIEKSYTAGEWFIDNNTLYVVKVNCKGIQPPDASYYKPTTVEAEFGQLNSELENFMPIKNIIENNVFGTIAWWNSTQKTYTYTTPSNGCLYGYVATYWTGEPTSVIIDGLEYGFPNASQSGLLVKLPICIPYAKGSVIILKIKNGGGEFKYKY